MNKEEFTAAAQRYREEMLRMQQQHHAVPAPTQSEQPMPAPMQPGQPMPPMQSRQPMSPPVQPSQPMQPPIQPRQPMQPPLQPRQPMPPPMQSSQPMPPPMQSGQPMSPPMQPRQPMPPPVQPRQPMPPPMQPGQMMPPPMQSGRSLSPRMQPRQPMPPPMQSGQPMPPPMQSSQPMPPPMQSGRSLSPRMQPSQPMPPPVQPGQMMPPPVPEEEMYPFSSFFPPNGWTGVSLPDTEVLREEGDRVALPVAAAQDSLPVDSADANGTLLISVRTAEGALPIEDALVTVTQERGGAHVLISSQRTNSSGKVRPLELPAPLTPPNQQRVPFAPYTIRVDADGYRSEQSLDVPVFAGITSRQNFLMKPLPLGTDAASDVVTYYNNEPIF